MATNPMPVMMRVMTLGAVALMIGVASSNLATSSFSAAPSPVLKLSSSR
jgi:hypothetical protein